MSFRYTFDFHYHLPVITKMAADVSGANIVEYDANENGVDAVTVFQTDRAEASSKLPFCQVTDY